MISFRDLFNKMKESEDKDISKEEFYNWLDNNLEISTYLPITKKYALIRIFTDKFNESIDDDFNVDEPDYILLMYDVSQMFVFLFEYIDNIFVLNEYRTVGNYDLIMNSGLFDYMMKYCKRDYDDCIQKCDRTTGINYLLLAKYVLDKINPLSAEEANKVKDIINNEIDKDKLEILRTLEMYNNPIMQKTIEKISEESVKEVMDKR